MGLYGNSQIQSAAGSSVAPSPPQPAPAQSQGGSGPIKGFFQRGISVCPPLQADDVALGNAARLGTITAAQFAALAARYALTPPIILPVGLDIVSRGTPSVFGAYCQEGVAGDSVFVGGISLTDIDDAVNPGQTAATIIPDRTLAPTWGYTFVQLAPFEGRQTAYGIAFSCAVNVVDGTITGPPAQPDAALIQNVLMSILTMLP